MVVLTHVYHPERMTDGGFGDFYFIIKRKSESLRKPTYEHRCDERLKAKAEGSRLLTYTGLCRLCEGLEHLKIKTRLINERFASVMGVCVI